MSNALGGITNADIRDSVGSYSLNAGALAIHGTNTENVLTTVAVEHVINGVIQGTELAIDSEIDISALTVLSAKDGSTLSGGTVTHAARAAGDANQTLVYILACKNDEVFVVEPDLSNAATSGNSDYSNYDLSCPTGYAPFGAVKVVRGPTDTAAFQFGNNTAATGDLDATGRTATFFDITHCPPTVALLIDA